MDTRSSIAPQQNENMDNVKHKIRGMLAHPDLNMVELGLKLAESQNLSLVDVFDGFDELVWFDDERLADKRRRGAYIEQSRVAHLINKWRKKQNAFFLGKQTFPDISNWHHITSITIDHCGTIENAADVLSWMGNMPQLAILNITATNMDIPPILECENLKTISIVKNDKIQTFPECLRHARGMGMLMLSYCPNFVKIPDLCASWNLSTFLVVNCPKFKTIPKWLSFMPIERLMFHDTAVESFPVWMCRRGTTSAKHLAIINMERTNITRLPDWVFLYTHDLQTLKMDDVRMESGRLPTSLWKRARLISLYAPNCNLSTVDGVENLKWLNTVYLNGNKLKTIQLPDANVQHIHLAGNRGLRNITRCISNGDWTGGHPRPQTLNVTGTRIGRDDKRVAQWRKRGIDVILDKQ